MRRILVLTLALLAACGKEEPPKPKAEPSAEAKPRLPVSITPAPAEGEVQEIVYREMEHARREKKRLVVYVGATWCEPCQRFHDAAKAGELDQAFPGMVLLEFDLDRDGDRLKRAGYVSKMIPLFALPRADGTASGLQIEGSIKGPGAVDQIRPRLEAMLSKVD